MKIFTNGNKWSTERVNFSWKPRVIKKEDFKKLSKSKIEIDLDKTSEDGIEFKAKTKKSRIIPINRKIKILCKVIEGLPHFGKLEKELKDQFNKIK